MAVTLQRRTEAHVRTYFARTQTPEIQSRLPSAAKTLADALRMFEAASRPGASSEGRTIYADGRYVGDVWCYAIGGTDADDPDAMLSFCLFEPSLWGRGICTEAVGLFLAEMQKTRGLRRIGAFAYADNPASLRVLEKNGFSVVERFVENDRWSVYCVRG